MNACSKHGRLLGALVAAIPLSVTLLQTTRAASAVDAWTLEAPSVDPDHYQGVVVSNGIFGIVSAPAPFEIAQTLMNGAYRPELASAEDSHELSGSYMPVFNPVDMLLAVDHRVLKTLAQTQHFRQRLDMRNASFTTEFDYQGKASITYTTRALRQLPNVALLEITVTALKPIDIEASAVLRAPQELRDVERNFGGYKNWRTHSGDIVELVASGRTGAAGVLVGAANAFVFDADDETVVTQFEDAQEHPEGIRFARHLEEGKKYHFALLGAIVSAQQHDNPVGQADRLVYTEVQQGLAPLVAGHDAAWHDLWMSDIRIDGSDRDQRDVHSMLYQLYSSARAESPYSIAPLGLTGQKYLGHIFWDTDIYIFPILLALHPEIAESLINYRFDRLPAAERLAASYGYRGAMFPWESSISGDDVSGYGEFEQHVTADVAIAAWNYYCVTGDLEWLRRKGYPLLKETADFWVSRVSRRGAGQFNIEGVMPPDETAEVRDNDAYTNAAARANLQYATRAARALHLEPDPQWLIVRQNIPILRFPDGIVREHSTYEGEDVKQADVDLLAYPLHETTDPGQIRKNLAFYSARIPGGPAMTKSIWAILHERLGEPKLAYEIFLDSYQPNLQPPFSVFGEMPKIQAGGYFLTGAGGVLQALIYGFGGLQITPHGLEQVRVTLPDAWQALTLTGIGPDHRTYRVNH